MNQDLMILIFGFILLFFGGSLLTFLLINRFSCNEFTEATIIAVKKKKMYFRGKEMTLSQPVYTYKIGDKKYAYEADFSTLKEDKYQVGDQAIIHYNPKKPTLPFIKQSLSSYVIGLLLAVPGLILVVCYFL